MKTHNKIETMNKKDVINPGNIAYPTIVLFGVAFPCFLCAFYLGLKNEIPLFAAGLINTLMAYLLFTPVHDAGHESISGNSKKLKFFEQVIGCLSCIPLMAPFALHRHHHNKHHRDTNHPEKDPDYYIAASSFKLVLVKALFVQAVGYYNVFKFKGCKDRKILIHSLITASAYIGIFSYLGLTFGWKYPIVLWFIPSVMGLWCLSIVFAWLPHHPHEETSRYKSSRIILNKVLSIISINQNYHLVHHLYPKIPFYKYPSAFRELEEELRENDALIEEVPIITSRAA